MCSEATAAADWGSSAKGAAIRSTHLQQRRDLGSPFSRMHQRLGDFHKPGSLVLLSVLITRGRFNTRLNSGEVWLHATGPSDTSLTHHTRNNATGKSSSQRAGATWGPNCSKLPITPTWARSWGQKGGQRQTLQWPPTHHVLSPLANGDLGRQSHTSIRAASLF